MSEYVYRTYSDFTVCLYKNDIKKIMEFVDVVEQDFEEYNSSFMLNLVCSLPNEYDHGKCEGSTKISEYLYNEYSLLNLPHFISNYYKDLDIKASKNPDVKYLYLMYTDDNLINENFNNPKIKKLYIKAHFQEHAFLIEVDKQTKDINIINTFEFFKEYKEKFIYGLTGFEKSRFKGYKVNFIFENIINNKKNCENLQKAEEYITKIGYCGAWIFFFLYNIGIKNMDKIELYEKLCELDTKIRTKLIVIWWDKMFLNSQEIKIDEDVDEYVYEDVNEYVDEYVDEDVDEDVNEDINEDDYKKPLITISYYVNRFVEHNESKI